MTFLSVSISGELILAGILKAGRAGGAATGFAGSCAKVFTVRMSKTKFVTIVTIAGNLFFS